ncbi:MAG: hypothetical protein AABZ53_14990 [Planctomycetota bacterium]
MRKPGTAEDNAQMSDFLCDFCGCEWTEELPMIEGHKGSLICGACLREACRRVVVLGENSAEEGYSCTLCLLTKAEPAWLSKATGAVVCHWCIDRSATMLAKDKDMGWTKPVA